MDKQNKTIVDDMVVTLDYLLQLEDGQEIDRSDSQEPLQFLQGHGQIVPGLEQSLYGMRTGDEKKVVVAAADAYGEFDSEDFETVSRNIFPPDMALQEGEQLQLRDSESGKVFQATVSELKEDEVILDFNHPLAGETLIFQVKIADLRDATSEELGHGHVHGVGHHH